MSNALELLRYGCESCEVCEGIVWVYKGKIGCGNKTCEKYIMGEVYETYKRTILKLEKKIGKENF